MSSRTRFRSFAVASAFVAASTVSACAREAVPDAASPVTLRVSAGAGAFERLAEGMAVAYEKARSSVRVSTLTGGGGRANALAIQDETTDIALTSSDIAYVAYTRGLGGRKYDRLRAIAVLHVSPVHVLARRGSGIRRLEDLRGRRIGAGFPGSATAATAEFVFAGMGLPVAEMRFEEGPVRGIRERFAAGELDALVHSGVAPLRLDIEADVLPIAGPAADQLLRTYPFVVGTVLPIGTYASATVPIPTVGVQVLLVCRAGLAEGLVHDFTQQFFEALPDLATSLDALRTMRLDESASTPIPLHPGAARFYRERELLR